MPAPAHVQVAPAGTGPNIDAQQLTSTESGSPIVDRQTVTLGDPTTYGNVATVEGDALNPRLLVRSPVEQEELLNVLYLISRELAAIRHGMSILIGQPLFEEDDRLQTGREKAH